MKTIICNIFATTLLLVLAVDLLYLHYDGLWYDPIPFILGAEIVVLFLIVLLGPILIIKNLKLLARYKG